MHRTMRSINILLFRCPCQLPGGPEPSQALPPPPVPHATALLHVAPLHGPASVYFSNDYLSLETRLVQTFCFPTALLFNSSFNANVLNAGFFMCMPQSGTFSMPPMPRCTSRVAQRMCLPFTPKVVTGSSGPETLAGNGAPVR